MALYRIDLLPSVLRKDLPKIPRKNANRIMQKISQLDTNPCPIWSKKLSSREEYRARQGNYRILYIIESRVVTITKIGNRKNIYD